MRVMRRAAVLMVLLGLSLGTPGIFAAPARSQAHRPAKTAAWSATHLFDALWSRIGGHTKGGGGDRGGAGARLSWLARLEGERRSRG